MKKLFFLFLLTLPTLFFAQNRKAWGFNMSSFYDRRSQFLDVNKNFFFKKMPKSGYSLGFHYLVMQESESWSMKYGVNWNIQNGQAQGVDVFSLTSGTGNGLRFFNYKLRFLEFPILLRYTGQSKNAYVEFGASPYFLVNSAVDSWGGGGFFSTGIENYGFIEPRIRAFGIFNAGLEFMMGEKIALFFQVESQFRYIGFRSSKDPKPVTTTFGTPVFQEGKALELRLGGGIGFRKNL